MTPLISKLFSSPCSFDPIVLKGNPVLHTLAVDPAYQKRGLGSRLIDVGLPLADKVGSKTYVEASDLGLPLYLKYGWREVDEIAVDVRKYGGKEIMVEKLLIREPQLTK